MAKKAKQAARVVKGSATKAKAKVNVKVKKSSPKVPVFREKQTRLEIFQTLADMTGLPKVKVKNLFEALHAVIGGHLRKSGSGEIILPVIGVKLRRVMKKKTKARKMTSPLTGTEVTIPAKPARRAIKVVILKSLKEQVE